MTSPTALGGIAHAGSFVTLLIMKMRLPKVGFRFLTFLVMD